MKKLVIIGGGFAGSTIAKNLQRKFETILIDTKDYFEYTPGILRTIVDTNHLKKIQRMHKDYLNKTKVIVGHVTEINKNKVIIGKDRYIFDYLAICSGSGYNEPIKEQDVVVGSRAEHLLKAHTELERSKNVLIIGGGLVGVELAAEICTFYKDKKIKLIHSHERLVPRNLEKTSRYVEQFLKKHNVELIFNEKLKEKKQKYYLTKNGGKIYTDMAFLTVGIKPNFEFMRKNFLDSLSEKNLIKVNEFLQVEGYDNIFAAGDIIDISEEKTAQNAECHSSIVSKNMENLENNKSLKEYKTKKRTLVISLGKYDGVIETKNLSIGGKVPAFLKWAIERWIMMGY